MNVHVIFYSAYGHIYRMADAALEGIRSVAGVKGEIFQVPEILPREVLEAMGIPEARKPFAHIPNATLETLKEADGLILATSTRYGLMAAPVKAFLDSTGGLWSAGEMIGKPAGVISSTATQHGGNEFSLISTQAALLHHGMIIVGLPYSYAGQMGVDEVKGGSPYGATTVAGGSGERLPSTADLDGARFLGARVAETAKKLRG